MSKLTLEKLYHDLKDKQVKLNGDLAELDFTTPIQGFSLTTELKRHMIWNNFIITKSSLKLITEFYSIEIWETAQIIQKNNRFLVKLKHTMYYLHVQNSI